MRLALFPDSRWSLLGIYNQSHLAPIASGALFHDPDRLILAKSDPSASHLTGGPVGYICQMDFEPDKSWPVSCCWI